MFFKKKDKFYVIVFAIIIVACLWAFISAAFITRNFKKEAAQNKLENKKVEVEDLLLTETKNNQKYWEIYADKGSYESNQKIVYVTNAVGNFYENGNVYASFQAPRATVNSETKTIILYDRSILVYKDLTNITADEFTYAGKNAPVTAKGHVIISKPGEFKLTANEAVLSDSMSKFKVKGKVVTKVYGKGKEIK